MPRVTGERYGTVVKFPMGTTVSKELIDKLSKGDKLYTRLDEVGETGYANPEEPIVLEYNTRIHNDAANSIFDGKKTDMLWFSYDVPDSIIPMNQELKLEVGKLKKEDGMTYVFNEFGELTPEGQDVSAGDSSSGDTEIYDP